MSKHCLTNDGLSLHCKAAYCDSDFIVYGYGGNGEPLTEEVYLTLISRYGTHYSVGDRVRLRRVINRARVYDNVGLIKAYATDLPSDITPIGFHTICDWQDMEYMPDTKGLLLLGARSANISVYIGNGEVIGCYDSTSRAITKSVFNTFKTIAWAKCPSIQTTFNIKYGGDIF